MGEGVQLVHGSGETLLHEVETESVHAIVTDNPGGTFWYWSLAAHKALKPGGHFVAVIETAQYHRLACAIEDAGFEIRDSLHWVYPNGHEAILLARKPFEGTVAQNVIKHGTAALNIEACRVPGEDERRWPPNFILSHDPRCLKGASCYPECPVVELAGQAERAVNFFLILDGDLPAQPLNMMRWLVRLVTPKGGVVLDPFMRNGTTAIAALAEGMRYIGAEENAEAYGIAARRVDVYRDDSWDDWQTTLEGVGNGLGL